MARYVELIGARGTLRLDGKPRARLSAYSGRWIVRFNVADFRIVCGRGSSFDEAYAGAYESACWFLGRAKDPHARYHP